MRLVGVPGTSSASYADASAQDASLDLSSVVENSLFQKRRARMAVCALLCVRVMPWARPHPSERGEDLVRELLVAVRHARQPHHVTEHRHRLDALATSVLTDGLGSDEETVVPLAPRGREPVEHTRG